MAYLGRGIENLSDRVVLDALTASATASYTLQLNSVNFVPSSASSLTVSLNGVIQKPDSSYTVSGSTLTFSSALTSHDSIDFIIAERGITLQTPSAGSVNTDQLATNSISTVKIQDDAVTKDKLLAHNYPAFYAHLSSSQSVSDNVITKVQANTELLDTDNCYDNSTNYRFTPNVAGKYLVFAAVSGESNTTDSVNSVTCNISKNNVTFTNPNLASSGGRTRFIQTSMVVVDMNGSSDYVELFGTVNINSGTAEFNAGTKQTYFGAYRIGD